MPIGLDERDERRQFGRMRACIIDDEQENLDKIFIPFYSTGNRQENWGLGLSYCYRVIMAHQGRIFVDSNVGQGTTVKILLPLNEEP